MVPDKVIIRLLRQIPRERPYDAHSPKYIILLSIFLAQTLTINGNPRLAYVHSGAITDVPKLAALDLSRNALFALESALPRRFPARLERPTSQIEMQRKLKLSEHFARNVSLFGKFSPLFYGI